MQGGSGRERSGKQAGGGEKQAARRRRAWLDRAFTASPHAPLAENRRASRSWRPPAMHCAAHHRLQDRAPAGAAGRQGAVQGHAQHGQAQEKLARHGEGQGRQGAAAAAGKSGRRGGCRCLCRPRSVPARAWQACSTPGGRQKPSMHAKPPIGHARRASGGRAPAARRLGPKLRSITAGRAAPMPQAPLNGAPVVIQTPGERETERSKTGASTRARAPPARRS